MMAAKSLKHPCHEHALTLRMLSNNCQIECSLCKLDFNGPAYCCEDCDYFLHRSCALIELPSEVRHPSHRRHLLTLSPNGDHNYSCSYCGDFTLHALTAIATLPPLGVDDKEHAEEEEVEEDQKDDEKMKIWHFAHMEHPLISFHVETKLLAKCKGCERRISGRVYGCRACLFLLHSSCALSPQVLDHPFSRLTLAQHGDTSDKCRACDGFISGFVYSRQDSLHRSFSLHTACALSTSFPRGHRLPYSTNFKVHSPHPCPLVLFHVEEEIYIRCKVCELRITGEARGCANCRFILHRSCAEKLPEVIHHFLHPDHWNLILEHRGPSMTWESEIQCHCATCLGAYPGFHPNACMAFQCHSCEFYLSPNCALETLAAVKEGAAASISHFAHEHPLLLHVTRFNYFNYCLACTQRIVGLAYCCVNCKSARLHKSCAELPQKLEHMFHSQHPLVLSKAPDGYFHCGACRKKSTGFAYCCSECKFYLDVGCASLNPTLKHPRHEHSLAYFKESMDDRLPCNACGKRCRRDLYLCVPCDFRLHPDCLPLPSMIEHRCHQLHPLFLRDKFVDGDPNDQYCDYCEELRNPDQGVYHCKECLFSAHIDCMISKDKVNPYQTFSFSHFSVIQGEILFSPHVLLDQTLYY